MILNILFVIFIAWVAYSTVKLIEDELKSNNKDLVNDIQRPYCEICGSTIINTWEGESLGCLKKTCENYYENKTKI